MRSFTTLILLALAMTIGAGQAFAQQASPNDTGQQERPDPRDDGNDDDDDDGNDDDDDDDGDDPLRPRVRLIPGTPCLTPVAVIDCPPPRRRKTKLVLVQKEPEECGCELKVIRVSGRFVTILDCYQSISVNGREQMRYCRKED